MLLKSCVAVLITDVGKLEFQLFPVSIICKTVYSNKLVFPCALVQCDETWAWYRHESCFVFPIQGSSMSNMHLSADTIFWSV